MIDSTPEERANLAWASVEQFTKSLDEAAISLEDPSLLEETVIDMLSQHGDHLREHIKNQKHVDPYKIVSWLGCALLRKVSLIKGREERCPSQAVARATILTLEGFLFHDIGVHLQEDSRLLLQRMLIREKQDNYVSDHGIWQNGLYAAFHLASKVGSSIKTAEQDAAVNSQW